MPRTDYLNRLTDEQQGVACAARFAGGRGGQRPARIPFSFNLCGMPSRGLSRGSAWKEEGSAHRCASRNATEGVPHSLGDSLFLEPDAVHIPTLNRARRENPLDLRDTLGGHAVPNGHLQLRELRQTVQLPQSGIGDFRATEVQAHQVGARLKMDDSRVPDMRLSKP